MALEWGTVNDHISYFDNLLLDVPGIGTTYVVRGDELAIVETGTSLSAPTVLAGLAQLGIRPDAVRHVVLTHVHMDHAGGAATLIKQMPDAQIYLHSATIPFLVDPTKLLESARRALGALFPAHGTMEPADPGRVNPAEALVLDLGRDVVLEAILTPGHSPDHISFLDRASGALIAGDAVGLVIPAYGYFGPVTPPPAIDVEAQQRTFDTLLGLPLRQLLFTHGGPSQADPRVVIERLRERYGQFRDLVQQGLDRDGVDGAAVRNLLLKAEPLPAKAEWALAGWVEMSIAGMTRYLSKRRGA